MGSIHRPTNYVANVLEFKLFPVLLLCKKSKDAK